ncbi:FecR family protein [Salinispira pacifica]|uniref:FecR protein domain-containing protein n=1 Tax=Salinispira pacifica TaxID=1307761 RepID=V5WL45_9SPIO|nr:FecR family protein [Salinispira pacifica]AHC16527.1 hypothetical protein L21SP2_3187 [Salinispira pacifica]
MFRTFRFVLLLAVLLMPAVTLVAQNGFIEYLEGDVTLQRSGNRITPDFGDELQQGDVLVTGGDGLVIINIDDRGQVKLLPDTELILDSIQDDISVELKRGGVFSRLHRLGGKEFDLRAGSMVAGVRGTEFFTLFGKQVEDEPDVWLCVNEGVVGVSVPQVDPSGETLVREGEGINILAGKTITDPRFYEWTTELNWNMDPQAGSVADDTSAEALYDDLLDIDYD